ncbi:MAG: carbohydrate kinase family protein [Anaerolineaceae bacterium]|nr:carbohydrate kinase family protein [Anaerolineaceae bacterium]
MILEKKVCIVSVGDLVMDINLSLQKLPVKHEEHQMLAGTHQEPGGAGNFLIAGARLGAKMVGLGAVGDDFYGHEMLRILNAEHVDVSLAEVQPQGQTTVIYVLNSPKQAQHVFLGFQGTGPLVSFSENWKAKVLAADAVQAYGYTLQEERMARAMLSAMQFAKENGKPVFFDPGPYVLGVPPIVWQEALRYTTALILTEEEIKYVLPSFKELEDAQRLFEYGIEMLVIKKGPNGSSVWKGGERFHVPGFKVDVVDTTAAGDSFGAAFIAGYSQGWSIPKVLRLANATGAAKVQKAGSGRQVPTLAEIEAIFYGP